MWYNEFMSVGMVPLPVPPVKAPNPNSFPASPKPFVCHTSGKSLRSSAPSNATATHLISIHDCANSFAVISFADPRPLTSVESCRCENGGGGVSSDETSIHLHFGSYCAKFFVITLLSDSLPS